MPEHPLPPSTHTVEMAQLAQLQEHLAAGSAATVTAQELGVSSALGGVSSGPLPASAVLVRVSWEGPPEYPYIHGHFAASGSAAAAWTAELHTDALRRLSQHLGLRHTWGAGAS